MDMLPGELQAWLYSAGVLVVAALVASLIYIIIHRALVRVTRKTKSPVDDALVRHTETPLKVILPMLAVLLALPVARLPGGLLDPLRHGVGLILIAAGAWLIFSFSRALEDVLAEQYRIDVADNLRARQVLQHPRLAS